MPPDQQDAVVAGRGAALRRCWSNHRLRKVLLAYLLFNIAEWASWIAILVWAYDWDGVRGASVVALVQLVPAAIVAPVLSARLARLRGPRALLLGYAAQAVTSLLVGAAIVLDAPVGLLAGLAPLYACSFTCTRPVHNILLPELSDTMDELTAGNAGSGWTEAAATLLGPLACGVLISFWGAGGVILAMGVGAAASVVLSAGLGQGAPRVAPRAGATGPGPLRVVWSDPAARLLTLLVAAEYALVGMMDILLVVLALDVLDLGDSGPGLLNSAIGIGGVLGAAATVLLVGAPRLTRYVVIAALVAGAPFALAGSVGDAVLASACIAGCGAGKTFFDVSLRTLVQRLLPDSRLAAVFGLHEATMMAGLAVGSLLAPVLVATAGAEVAFLVAGAFLPAVALGVWLPVRRLDDAAVVPHDVLALLSRIPMLAVLAPRVRERLAVFSSSARAEPDEAVVVEGEAGDLFYVVRDGEVVVSHGTDVIRTLGPGSWFGELALLHPQARRTATVTAVDAVDLVTIDRHTFLSALAGGSTAQTLADDHARQHYR